VGPATPPTRATDRTSRSTRPGFDDETVAAFKTPSLLYVGGAATAPSSSARCLPQRARKTSQLTNTEKTALVAYLQTIGGYTTPPAELPKRAPGAFASRTARPASREPRRHRPRANL
jgi:hypothetical protein